MAVPKMKTIKTISPTKGGLAAARKSNTNVSTKGVGSSSKSSQSSWFKGLKDAKKLTPVKKPMVVSKAKTMDTGGRNKIMMKYNRMKDFVKYYRLKKRLLPGQFTASDATRETRFTKLYRKLRKQVSSLLIQDLRKKRAARGRGKKRGSDLARLGSKA